MRNYKDNDYAFHDGALLLGKHLEDAALTATVLAGKNIDSVAFLYL